MSMGMIMPTEAFRFRAELFNAVTRLNDTCHYFTESVISVDTVMALSGMVARHIVITLRDRVDGKLMEFFDDLYKHDDVVLRLTHFVDGDNVGYIRRYEGVEIRGHSMRLDYALNEAATHKIRLVWTSANNE